MAQPYVESFPGLFICMFITSPCRLSVQAVCLGWTTSRVFGGDPSGGIFRLELSVSQNGLRSHTAASLPSSPITCPVMCMTL